MDSKIKKERERERCKEKDIGKLENKSASGIKRVKGEKKEAN